MLLVAAGDDNFAIGDKCDDCAADTDIDNDDDDNK